MAKALSGSNFRTYISNTKITTENPGTWANLLANVSVDKTRSENDNLRQGLAYALKTTGAISVNFSLGEVGYNPADEATALLEAAFNAGTPIFLAIFEDYENSKTAEQFEVEIFKFTKKYEVLNDQKVEIGIVLSDYIGATELA